MASQLRGWLLISQRHRVESFPRQLCFGTVRIFTDHSFERHTSFLVILQSCIGLPDLQRRGRKLRFNERLVEAIARSERTGDAMALVFLDVDHFKAINDQFGHSGGDLALQEVARRLCNSVRPSDSVARLAGDEFVIILEPLSIKGDAEVVARRIVSAMKSPFRINGAQSAVSCSLGVAVRRRGEVDGPSLLRRADNMLYRMKEAGRGGCLVED